MSHRTRVVWCNTFLLLVLAYIPFSGNILLTNAVFPSLLVLMFAGGYCALCFNIAVRLLLSLQHTRCWVGALVFSSSCFSLGPRFRAFFQDLLILKDEHSTFL
jgi:hypothetical protein